MAAISPMPGPHPFVGRARSIGPRITLRFRPNSKPVFASPSLLNGRESRFPPPPFREFLPVLGQISQLQNPLKYRGIREINPEAAHPVSHPHHRYAVSPVYSVAYLPLKVPERPLPNNYALTENAWSTPTREDSQRGTG